jgi:peptidoglycan hydrolase-like protein with peptidoglycan-binding domain
MTKEQEQAFVAAHSRAHDAPASNAPTAEAHAEHAQAGHANVHRQGDHSAAVGQLQGDLAALGFTARNGSPIHPDQRFGPLTMQAVEAFQTAHGLHADGMAGPATLSAITQAKANTQAPVQDIIGAPVAHAQGGHANVHRQGDHGTAVGQLQGDLAALGFTARDGSPIHPDLRFGPLTKQAVEAFQAAHGLHTDGVAGPATQSAITQAKAPHTPTQASVPDLRDPRHPAHGIYEQAYTWVARLGKAQGRDIGPHTQALAGSLTSAATAAGFNRIDHVTLSDDASQGFAIQGALNSPIKQYASVNLMQAIQTPLAQSSHEAAAHLQSNAQQQKPVQQAAPSMVR